MRAIASTIRSYAPRLPKGRGDAALQVGLFVLADLCYETVRGIAEGNANLAFANARSVIDFEGSVGLFFEPDLQRALLGQQWIIDIANFTYMNRHFVVTTVFLVWLYLYRNDSFYFVRNMFMVAMGLALVGYTLMPTAPPRFFEELGFVDTIDQVAQVNHDSALVQMFVNPYAAIPSMHCAFALMIGVSGALLSRHTITRALWCLYPLFVFFVVVVTGNHFWVDGAIGWMVAGVGGLRGGPARAGAPGGMVLATGDRLTDQPGGGPQTARRLTEPALVAGLLGVVYLIVEPSSADHAAQVFRSGLFEQRGALRLEQPLVRWPPPARLRRHLPAAGLADRPARRRRPRRGRGGAAVRRRSPTGSWGERARLGVIWFAAGASISLFTGRLTFALGVAIALAAVFASQRGWRAVAVVFAAPLPARQPGRRALPRLRRGRPFARRAQPRRPRARRRRPRRRAC